MKKCQGLRARCTLEADITQPELSEGLLP